MKQWGHLFFSNVSIQRASYLETCLEEGTGDATFIAKALEDIARTKGMSQVARDAGLSPESLCKALSGERTPGFDTILKVMGALGLKLHAEAVRANTYISPPVAGGNGEDHAALTLVVRRRN